MIALCAGVQDGRRTSQLEPNEEPLSQGSEGPAGNFGMVCGYRPEAHVSGCPRP